ncbi:hypothetical protein [Botrimarina sp.]|uniref:hypothetical protein n=1 Tax=Botrimarina sp. TaxID=2795802 RepID=UPI0032EAC589
MQLRTFSQLRDKIALLIASLAVAALSAATADAAIEYREIFPNDSSTAGQGQLAIDQSWFAGQHDNSIASPPDGQISVSTGSTELPAINSNPVGPTADTGFAFFSPDQRAGVYIYTNEYSFQSSDLNKVIWESRNNTGTATQPRPDIADFTDMHLVFRVDGEFYVSDTGVLHVGDRNAWTMNMLDPSTLTFGLFDTYIGGDTTTLPRRTTTAGSESGLALPDGTVDLFGLYIEKNFGTIRVDNFALDIDSAVVPEASAGLIWLLLTGLAGARGRMGA